MTDSQNKSSENPVINYSKQKEISQIIKPKKIGRKMRYYLGKKYPGIFFTTQEAKCMFYCLEKLTSKKIGIMMNIHFRTVEYYRDNIRCKIAADSKKELIEKIKSTNFMEYMNYLKKICRKP